VRSRDKAIAPSEPIEFNRAHVTGSEFGYMQEAIQNAHLASSGPFSKRCSDWLVERIGCKQAFLTHSCTGALELAFTLADVGPGDEVVMPSFTFVTTANAVVARGGRPVFVDIRPDTLGIDEELVEAALTVDTKAIVPVHYAGVGCEMGMLGALSAAHNVRLIEDAAQGIGATVDGRPLGGIGHLGALSFHETKNVSCGEGGALLVNDSRFLDRAEVVLEKGTNRRRFLRGKIDKYTWVDVGSSYALSELAAAYLWAQLEHESEITEARIALWNAYHSGFAELESEGLVRRPVVPDSCRHNAHMYYLLVRDLTTRTKLIAHLASRGIHAVFHYVPLHTSRAGRRYARSVGRLEITIDVSRRLVRLPLWADIGTDKAERVVSGVLEFFDSPQRATRSPRRATGHSVAGRPE
jgi:dTDP-4-amino-4,6-dideoxygalactose transaminase